MKIAIAQINTIIGDFAHNLERIQKYAGMAADSDCDLVVFPELVIPGYPPRDLLEQSDFVEKNISAFHQVVNSIRGVGVICGYVDKNPAAEGNPLCNTAVLFEDGSIIQTVRKRLLPTYDVFDETRYFEPGSESRSVVYKGRQIGLTICEDIWNDKDYFHKRVYHTDPVAEMVEDGAEIIVNIAASPFHAGKQAFRKDMLSSIAKKYGVVLVYANQVGGNDSLLFDGTSMVFDSGGDMIAGAGDFREDFIVCDLSSRKGDHHRISSSEIESVFNALVMGTRDYVNKCGFSEAVVGLSGGIDSALTACVAVSALGKDKVSAVFMPSQYTSRDNFEDTRKLAENLGIGYEIIPIDDLFHAFLYALADYLRQDEEPGITEQNIQARIRGTLLMALSNERGSILLSTGNKSEMAVGYCTLYGDMNGGLSVISDVPKVMVYDISRRINAKGEIIPDRIITKAPSAELKPDQTDQDDLPPYDILDRILKAYVEEALAVDDIVAMGFDRGVVEDVITRINRSEYKRHQAAPGLKVTTKAFGYGRRYPIAQKFK
jgi:NAD+ synthase/NAD+ synthase (glutamine-hydrolysing)